MNDEGNWKLDQIYHCKICSACNPLYGFGNFGWAASHDNLVHGKDLTESRLEIYYEEMHTKGILKAR